jgi:hypothetical protein
MYSLTIMSSFIPELPRFLGRSGLSGRAGGGWPRRRFTARRHHPPSPGSRRCGKPPSAFAAIAAACERGKRGLASTQEQGVSASLACLLLIDPARRSPTRSRDHCRGDTSVILSSAFCSCSAQLVQMVECLHPRHERRADALKHRAQLWLGAVVRFDAGVERAR